MTSRGTLRAVQVIDSLGVGGAERLLVVLAHEARECGIDLAVVTLAEATPTAIRSDLTAAAVQVIDVPSSASRELLDVARLRRLRSVLRRLEPDVVHTHLLFAHVHGLAAARTLRVPTVATLHNVAVDPQRRSRVRGTLEAAALRYGADLVVAVGSAVAETHAPRLRGVPEILRNPAPTLRAPAPRTRERLRAEFGLGPTDVLLFGVGRLAPQKGFDVLIDAIGRLTAAGHEIHLVLAGTGRLHDELATHVASAGLADRIRLLGVRDDVPDLLHACDVFVSSSRWEGVPVAVLEAMAAGTAVVATSVGDVPAMVDDAAVIVPPDDADALAAGIARVLDDPHTREELGSRLAQRAEESFSAAAWASQLRAIYNRVSGRDTAQAAGTPR